MALTDPYVSRHDPSGGSRTRRLAPSPPQGREQLHGRHRLRRLVAAALVGAAVLAVLTVLSPESPASRDVLVATRALPAGAVLRPADVRTVAWPEHLVPQGTVGADAVTGRAVTAALAPGEPITRARVRGSNSLLRVPGAEVILALSVPDEILGSAIEVGDRIDVYAPEGARVAAAVAVVATDSAPAARPAMTAGGQSGRTILVAAPATTAQAVAAARSRAPTGALTVALRPAATP